jgi:hypothetical protein
MTTASRRGTRFSSALKGRPKVGTTRNASKRFSACSETDLQLRLRAAVASKSGAQDSNRGEARKRPIAIANVHILRVRETPIINRGTGRQRHDPGRIRDLERAQEECVGQAENRGVGANGQPDREDGGTGEPGTASERAHGVPKIVHNRLYGYGYRKFVPDSSLL